MTGSTGTVAADSLSTVLRVQLTQIQNAIIGAAHSESQVDPTTFASLLRHDLDDVHAAINDLVNRGLVAPAEDDTFRLTDQGEAVHRAQEDAHRADVISRTGTWQRH
jgi:Mn-dependent DtxR family transcriptional regulator